MAKLPARTRARLRAVDTLYEAHLKGLDEDSDALKDLVDERLQVSTAQTPIPPYTAEIVRGIADELDIIDAVLAGYSKQWDLDRMAQTDLATLRVAVWEMMFNDEVDQLVSINEAIAISRRISTPDSPAFINGVLDAVMHDPDGLVTRMQQLATEEYTKVDKGQEISLDAASETEDETLF
ncbi:MAG: transcription antitermination factor NusB [Varibaculum sp.]|nr:transcription antitermination factor NusB [Varibaculum sp.]